MTLQRLKRHIRSLLDFIDLPQYILLHVAGHDIGNTRLGVLNWQVARFLTWLSETMPNTRIIWSQILPRKNWRYSNNLVAMEKCRKRLNSSIRAYVVRNGGYYIKYPDIVANDIFIKSDGVHLTKLGNDIFLNPIQANLESIIVHA